ncbi:hypothetical protein CWE25_13380 [Idiomarina fontislapidosi]|uniref:Uncharacterized protein n=1 Tax=Idiomarina fontislapidosi TaxID=263723 RepID=A0A432XET1_9GAMM|nr:hypothetical protein CWE25_13380 [Idiomarina fontislapidosi]
MQELQALKLLIFSLIGLATSAIGNAIGANKNPTINHPIASLPLLLAVKAVAMPDKTKNIDKTV